MVVEQGLVNQTSEVLPQSAGLSRLKLLGAAGACAAAVGPEVHVLHPAPPRMSHVQARQHGRRAHQS